MAGLTKEQRAARAAADAHAKMLANEGLTQEQFDALSDDERDSLAATEKSADEIEFVKMIRDALVYPAPHEANVHPAEVSNFARGGWEIV